MPHAADMDSEARNTLDRVKRIRPHSGNVVDFERVKLQRELRQLRARLDDEQWETFMRELVAALAANMRMPGQ